MLERLVATVTQRPYALLCAVLGLAVAASIGAFEWPSGRLKLSVDSGMERLLPTGDAARVRYDRTVSQFGSDRSLVAVMVVDDVFTAPVFEQIDAITRELVRLPGVADVASLASVPNPKSDDDTLDLATFTESGLADPARMPALRDDLANHPLYRGVLVSEDARAAAFIVSLREGSDADLDAVTDQVRAVVTRVATGAVHLTGASVVKRATAELLLRELRFAVPAVFAFAALVLVVAFGSLRGVVFGVLAMGLSVGMVLGVLGWLERPLNLVTVIVPPFVITLGLAYAMHVLEAFTETTSGTRQERAGYAVRQVGVAVAVTALTTAAGLAALGIHPLAAIREFGWLALLGIVFSGGLSIVLLPALLAVAGPPARRAPPGAAGFYRVGDRLAAFALRRRREVLLVGLLFLAFALLSLFRLSVGTAYIENLPEDHVARRDFEAIDRFFGSATGLLVAIETNHRDAVLEPELLTEIEAFQNWLYEQPEVAGSVSIVDHLKVLNAGLMGPEEGFVLPDSAELAKQLLIFGGGDALNDVSDAAFRRTLIRVRATTPDTRELASLVTRIESRAKSLPAGVGAAITGEAVLLAETLSRIARGQVQSMLAALLFIYIVLAALFSSLRVGLLALLPNALPIAFYFGVLALAGIPLTPSTSLIACIALGIAVDDTIHYLVRFNAEARRTTREDEATRLALRAVIRPVTFTTLALCLGFLVFTGSDLQNQVQFGALAASTLAFAWLIDVTLTPALCSGVRIVTLWDVLRLDLGPAPQSSISLFDGLSPRQTRLFALTADIQNFSAGETVRREGEHARDMFVVLDGEVEVWTERAGSRVVLHHAARGDMVGEFSFFAERHGATVDAVHDARLLRFEDIDLELMMRRYPRAAARIYANLNKIQAARLVEASSRMESL